MALQQAADILNGTLQGTDARFSSVSTDTRRLKKGDLYIALQGENFDGHDFIDQAAAGGAVGAIVHRDVVTDLSCIKVEDTRLALGQLAAAWRLEFDGKVVAVTGSNGKTTVKEMLAAILAEQGKVLATEGNYNNDIGLPLTLLRMQNEDYAVIEMGANHAGEIAYLSAITKPDVAIITNAGNAHLQGFGSIKGVAAAKGEIYQGLSENGLAIFNRDDDYSDYWQSLCKERKILSFSMRDKSATVYGEWQQRQTGIELSVVAGKEKFVIQMKVFGVHNAMNALAAICAARALNINSKKIVDGLAAFSPVKGRLNIHSVAENLCVIDDTYNANPASLSAAMDVLAEMPGEHWLVLGDMGELGEDDIRLHFDAGVRARESGVSRLLALGQSSRHAVEAFGEGGIFFNNRDELVEYIKENQSEALGILIKGSRFMHMEQIVESLTEGDG